MKKIAGTKLYGMNCNVGGLRNGEVAVVAIPTDVGGLLIEPIQRVCENENGTIKCLLVDHRFMYPFKKEEPVWFLDSKSYHRYYSRRRWLQFDRRRANAKERTEG